MNIKDYFKIDLSRDVKEQLDFLASITLNNSRIVVNNKNFIPLEVEILCYIKGYHEDPWLHSSYSQMNHLNWYFHGKSQNRYSTDLTFGDIDNEIYASMLIRRIKSEDGSTYLDGPSKVTNFLLSSLNLSSVGDFEKRDRKGAIKFANPNCFFDLRTNLNPMKIYALPRTRELSKNHLDSLKSDSLDFFFAPYRYISEFKEEDSTNYFNYMWLKQISNQNTDFFQKNCSANIHKKHLTELDRGYKSDLNSITSTESITNRSFQLLGHYMAINSINIK